jgi:hypothetical protein
LYPRAAIPLETIASAVRKKDKIQPKSPMTTYVIPRPKLKSKYFMTKRKIKT